MTPRDEDLLDGCDLDFAAEALPPAHQGLFPLFAEALDPGTEKTVEEAAAEWRELFSDRNLPRLPRSALPPPRTVATGFDTGIADRLRAAGLKVVEVAGWKTRGSSTFSPRGSLDHHTAGGSSGNAPSLSICTYGRSDLPGPLCQVLMGRDNTCYVIAAGRANHAGAGSWRGLTGNTQVYGLERENVGTPAEPWRPDQTEAAARAHAALIGGRATADYVCRHAEWAPTRKIDSHSVAGSTIRSKTAGYLSQPQPPNPLVKSVDEYPEDSVKTAFIEVPHRGYGLGFAEWDPGLGRDPVIVGAVVQGPYPPVDGWWDNSVGATVRAQPRAGKVAITTAGAKDGQSLYVFVSVA